MIRIYRVTILSAPPGELSDTNLSSSYTKCRTSQTNGLPGKYQKVFLLFKNVLYNK